MNDNIKELSKKLHERYAKKHTMSFDLTLDVPNPKWYQFKRKLSDFFLFLAKKIYPENPKVYAFLCKQAVDAAIYGQSITNVSPFDLYESIGRKKED